MSIITLLISLQIGSMQIDSPIDSISLKFCLWHTETSVAMHLSDFDSTTCNCNLILKPGSKYYKSIVNALCDSSTSKFPSVDVRVVITVFSHGKIKKIGMSKLKYFITENRTIFRNNKLAKTLLQIQKDHS